MKLNHSFVSRVLRLTLLAPDVVEAILDGRQAEAAQRQGLLHDLPGCWAEQLSLVRMTEARLSPATLNGSFAPMSAVEISLAFSEQQTSVGQHGSSLPVLNGLARDN